MEERLSLRVVNGGFLGNCLIITDNNLGKSVEVMALQLKGIVGGDKSTGSLPHADWDKEGEEITIRHNGDAEGVTFTMQELAELL